MQATKAEKEKQKLESEKSATNASSADAIENTSNTAKDAKSVSEKSGGKNTIFWDDDKYATAKVTETRSSKDVVEVQVEQTVEVEVIKEIIKEVPVEVFLVPSSLVPSCSHSRSIALSGSVCHGTCRYNCIRAVFLHPCAHALARRHR